MLSNSVGNRDHKIDFFFPRLSLVSSSQTKLDSTINTPLRSVSLPYNICVISGFSGFSISLRNFFVLLTPHKSMIDDFTA